MNPIDIPPDVIQTHGSSVGGAFLMFAGIVLAVVLAYRADRNKRDE